MAWKSLDRSKLPFEPDAPPVLDESLRGQILALQRRYPTKQALTLPALHLIQQRLGYLPPKALVELAELLDLAPAQGLDTVSFYEMFHTEPLGRYIIGVCRSVTCEICGSEQIRQAIERKLSIKPNQTTADGKFTLLEFECLAACDRAPCMLINETLYGPVKPEDIDEILDACE